MSLIELLRRFEEVYADIKGTTWIGAVRPEQAFGRAIAQLEAMQAEMAELKESWLYLHKWVERGLFCKSVTPTEALECIAHHPTAPWKNGRWDVDHKDYAGKFYEKFPKARASLDHQGK